MDIQPALLDHVAIHGTVEPGIIDHIINVPVDVIIRPARGDLAKMPIGVTSLDNLLRQTHSPVTKETSASSVSSGASFISICPDLSIA